MKCLYCSSNRNLKREKGTDRIFCGQLCQLKITEGDEAGYPVDDDDIIGIANKRTGRKFRITRKKAQQLTTIADLLMDTNNVDNYIEIEFDDFSFAYIVDFLRLPSALNDVEYDKLSDDQFFNLITAATYFGAESFLWRHLYLYLANKLRSLVFKKDHEQMTNILKRYAKFLPNSFYLFPTYYELVSTSTYLLEFYSYEMSKIKLQFDYKTIQHEGDDYDVIAMSTFGSLHGLKMLRAYFFIQDSYGLWSKAFNVAALKGHLDIVIYLKEELKQYINVPEAFKKAISAGKSVVADYLFYDSSITLDDKYEALRDGIKTISIGLAEKILENRNIPVQEIFDSAIINNRSDIVHLLIDRATPTNEQLKFAARNGFENIVVELINDPRIDCGVILEREKTPNIVAALRDRYSKKIKR
jgi:hypothetical protein